MKILLTCSNDHPGVKTHLKKLEGVLGNGAKFMPMEALISEFPDYRKAGRKMRIAGSILKRIAVLRISAELRNYGQNIIIGSWKPYYLNIVRALNRENISPSVLWCSTVGQTEMTWMVELAALNTILKLLASGNIRYLFVPERTYESLSHLKNVKYLPHPIDISILSRQINKTELEGFNVDLFMKARPGKNILQQLISKRYAKTKYTLHTNIDHKEILEIAEGMGIPLVGYSWVKGDKYFNLIASMDLSLQVTWSESFNYAACERILLGVPVLVSHVVFWINRDGFLREHLVVENCDSPIEIAKKIDYLLGNRELSSEIIACGRNVLKTIAEKYNCEIHQQMENCF